MLATKMDLKVFKCVMKCMLPKMKCFLSLNTIPVILNDFREFNFGCGLLPFSNALQKWTLGLLTRLPKPKLYILTLRWNEFIKMENIITLKFRMHTYVVVLLVNICFDSDYTS